MAALIERIGEIDLATRLARRSEERPDGRLRRPAAGDRRPAALDQSRADHLPARARPLRRPPAHSRAAARGRRTGAARRRALRSQGRVPARPRHPRDLRRARARPSRRAHRRGGDRGDRRRPRPRPVDRGDVPALPPRAPRRPLRGRPRHPQGDPDRVRAGGDADARAGAGDRRALATRTAASRPSTCGSRWPRCRAVSRDARSIRSRPAGGPHGRPRLGGHRARHPLQRSRPLPHSADRRGDARGPPGGSGRSARRSASWPRRRHSSKPSRASPATSSRSSAAPCCNGERSNAAAYIEKVPAAERAAYQARNGFPIIERRAGLRPELARAPPGLLPGHLRRLPPNRTGRPSVTTSPPTRPGPGAGTRRQKRQAGGDRRHAPAPRRARDQRLPPRLPRRPADRHRGRARSGAARLRGRRLPRRATWPPPRSRPSPKRPMSSSAPARRSSSGPEGPSTTRPGRRSRSPTGPGR